MKKLLRKLTEEEKQRIAYVVNDLLAEDLPETPNKYDLFMKEKLDEFTSLLLQDNIVSEIEALLELCEDYIRDEGNSFGGLGLIMMYDMWLNKSSVWPVPYNPEWEEWDKLKNEY